MLFFLSCSINTHPIIPPHIQDEMYELQQHVQRIEELANQLLDAQKKEDASSIEEIMKNIESENTELQKQKQNIEKKLKYSNP